MRAFSWSHALQLVKLIGKARLVIDLSCRKKAGVDGWFGGLDRELTHLGPGFSRGSRNRAACSLASPHAYRSLIWAFAIRCCARNRGYRYVAINRWQTTTDLELNRLTVERLAQSCDEFLVHAADVEGLCQGIDTVGAGDESCTDESCIDGSYMGGGPRGRAER